MVCSFQGCINKAPQIGWIRTTYIYSVTVTEPRSSKRRCQQSHDPCAGCKGGSCLASPQLLVLAIHPWRSLACVCITLPSASVTTWHLPCGTPPPVFIKTQVILTMLWYDPIVTNDICNDLFPNKVNFWEIEGSDFNLSFWRHKLIHRTWKAESFYIQVTLSDLHFQNRFLAATFRN